VQIAIIQILSIVLHACLDITYQLKYALYVLIQIKWLMEHVSQYKHNQAVFNGMLHHALNVDQDFG